MPELKVRKLRPEFGVEISGLEPHVPLDDDTCRVLRQLFDDRSLLVFRSIDADLKFQTYLSELLIGRDALAPDAAPPIDNWYVSNQNPSGSAYSGRLLFHSDMMWVESGCQLLSLYGITVEQPAVPTLFVSSGHAWDTLPDDLRKRVQGRVAVHTQDATSRRRASMLDDVLVSRFESEERLRLPVAYPHPRTGCTLLYVCPQMTLGIEGLSPQDSEELLEALFDHIYARQNQFEHHWREGDLVLWDNIALQHARPNVTGADPARTLRKTIAPTPRLKRAGPKQHIAGS